MRTDPAVVDEARRAISRGSKSFSAAARLFDRETRDSVVMLYAWCRHCDDVVDGQTLGHGQAEGDRSEAAERVARLYESTRAAVRGKTVEEPAFAGLAVVTRKHGIPERLLLEHLNGFRHDVEGRVYHSFEDTLDYCYGVAGVVGVMMALVMGVRHDATLDRACDLGLAFQLTNIARDVVEDASIGRVYLPQDWLVHAGVPPDDLIAPQHRAALATVAARLVEAAEPYYRSAGVGLRALPIRSAWAIAAARGVYRAIGVEVRRRGESAWDERVATSKLDKVCHLLNGAGAASAARTIGRLLPEPPRQGLWARPTAEEATLTAS